MKLERFQADTLKEARYLRDAWVADNSDLHMTGTEHGDAGNGQKFVIQFYEGNKGW